MTKIANLQIILDVNKKPAFAVIPWGTYKKLQSGGSDETAMLIAAGEAARNDETFPEEIARRLVAGEAPLKIIREWRRLTQDALAKKSGVSKQYISQIERRLDGRTLGRNAARKLVPVLGVSIDVLMEL